MNAHCPKLPAVAHLFLSSITAAIIIACGGCVVLMRPSTATRHASYAPNRSKKPAETEIDLGQVYVIFSGDSKFSMTMSDNGSVTFNERCCRGLAVGIDEDGYLLTAGHVVDKVKFVLGSFHGKVSLFPARLVFKNDFKFPADVAILKVNERLDQFAHFGQKPKIGEQLVEAACYDTTKGIGGEIDYIGGTVISIAEGPKGSAVALVETDIPAWHGDSGGPLFSNNGELVGIFSEFTYTWFGHAPRYRTTSFFPDIDFIQSLINKDRVSMIPR